MTEEKFDAFLENKEYEAAFDLVDKENFENFKRPQNLIMNLRTKKKPALISLMFKDIHLWPYNFSVSKGWKRIYWLGWAIGGIRTWRRQRKARCFECLQNGW